MLDFTQTTNGVILPVRAKPSARRNAIDGLHDRQLKISITAAPEKGKANKAIVALLSKTLNISKSSFEIISGETSGKKRILIRGVSLKEIAEKLQCIVDSLGTTKPQRER